MLNNGVSYSNKCPEMVSKGVKKKAVQDTCWNTVPTGVSKISCRECLINSMPDCAESLIAFYVSCVPTTSLMVEVRIEAKL